MCIGYYFLIFFQSACALAEANSVPFVAIQDGSVIGSYRQTLGNKSYVAFEGIPFAAPPLENLRFLPPQPVLRWKGVLNATFVRNMCPQPRNGVILGDENCLHINVYVPEPAFTQRLSNNTSLNVLVYIHGGSFFQLSGNTVGPQYLFEESDDIIFVTFNYRLGILGFISLGDEIIPGNNGLKDQVAALKWVQRNIGFFGGNPEKVTLSGLSTGGASVHLHMLSAMSKGLFQKAISDGGTALIPLAISTNVTARSLEIVSSLGCPTLNSNAILRCMQKITFQLITAAILRYQKFSFTPATPFGPVVEPCVPDAFISTHPLYLINESQETMVPWLVTLNRNEGLFPGADIINNATLMKDLSANWLNRFEPLLHLNHVIPQDLMEYTINRIKNFYFDDQTIGYENSNILIKMLTERTFFNGIELSVKLHASKCNNTVYMYLFNYRGQHSTTEFYTNSTTNFGVSHGDDSLYVIFDSNFQNESENSTIQDREMRSIISNVWISFIRKGVPERGNLEWPALSCKQDRLTFLSIYSPNYSVRKDVSVLGSQTFWDSLPFTPFDGYNTFCYTFKAFDY